MASSIMYLKVESIKGPIHIPSEVAHLKHCWDRFVRPLPWPMLTRQHPGRPASPLPSGAVVASMFVLSAPAPHSSSMTGLRRLFLHTPGAGSEMGV